MAEESKPKYKPWQEHLIAHIFPKWEVHLVAGPSGAGKTSWLVKVLQQWSRGEKFFDFETKPCKFIYVSIDRSKNGMYRTLERVLQIEPETYPLYIPSSRDKDIAQVMTNAVKASKREDKEHVLMVIEGIATFVTDGKGKGAGNDGFAVAHFLKRVAEMCIQLNCTVIGVVHSAKQKEKDRYGAPRERIAGASQWAAYSETVIFIEPVDPETSNALRKVYIMPRNWMEVQYEMEWQGNNLIRIEPKAPKSGMEQMTAPLIALKPDANGDTTFKRQWLLQETKIAERSFERLLEILSKAGAIQTIEKGTFKLNFDKLALFRSRA